jgi:chaperonin GroEL
MTAYSKTKSPAKVLNVRHKGLEKIVLDTMQKISGIVGATLGPGGAAVLIERQEFGLPPLVTKDGVTVFHGLGFRDPTAHAVMEAARDAAVRTVSEAGDGTTTATVLAAALVELAQEYHCDYPHVPPQRIVERLRGVFEQKLLPLIQKMSRKVSLETEEGRGLLRSVATISANGDQDLADAVMQCFDEVGDQGTVTLSERSGPPGYVVERMDGYPVPVGYEDSAAKFMGVFVNDPQNSRCHLNRPYFILYNGVVGDIQAVYGLIDRLQLAWLNRPGGQEGSHDPNQPFLNSPNIVIVANGFSEQVLGGLALNFKEPNTINVVPLVTPRSPLQNGEAHFLDDLAAITGSSVLDCMNRNFDYAKIPGEVDGMGNSASDIGQVNEFEMLRFRSTIMGHSDEDLIVDRANILEGMVRTAISELDARLLRERLGALTGGIAKLWVVGGSQGELRERKDRADDAVRAVQGSLKHGVLPGGGWTLIQLAKFLFNHYPAESPESGVLGEALLVPVRLLLSNTGLSENQARQTMDTMGTSRNRVWDAARQKWVRPYVDGILDSTPAVREAIRNSISIASLLGTLGGTICFPRDDELDRQEALSTNSFMRDASSGDLNPANDRA